MAGYYLLFSSLAPLSGPLKPVIGEIADVMMMTAYLWPYPLLMALQNWPPFESLWPLVILAGLGLVVAFGAVLRQSFHAFSKPTGWGHVSAAVLWYVPLILAQAIFVFVAWSLGYPVGE
jgi:hypothetical protein